MIIIFLAFLVDNLLDYVTCYFIAYMLTLRSAVSCHPSWLLIIWLPYVCVNRAIHKTLIQCPLYLNDLKQQTSVLCILLKFKLSHDIHISFWLSIRSITLERSIWFISNRGKIKKVKSSFKKAFLSRVFQKFAKK